MRDLRWSKLWLGLWGLGIALCIVLSLIPPPDLPAPPQSDKLGHLLTYFALSAWAVQLFASRRALAIAALGLVALGIAIEFAQGALTVTRQADWRDALANTAGVALGLLLARTRWAEALLRFERRWR